MEKISWLDYEEAELHGGWPDQRIESGWVGSGREVAEEVRWCGSRR